MSLKRHITWLLCLSFLAIAACSESSDEDGSNGLPWEKEPIIPVSCDPPPHTTPPPVTENNLPDETSFHVETLTAIDETDSITNGIIVEDLDGDGFLDIAAPADMQKGLGSKMIFLWGDGSGVFETKTELIFPDGYRAFSACVAADLEGDGDLDILIGTFEGDVVILRATEPREYEIVLDAVEYPPDATWEWVVLIMHLDLDQQGGKDLIVGTHGLLSGTGQGHCVGVASDPGDGSDIQMAPPSVLIPPQLHCLVHTEEGKFVPAPDGVCPAHVDAQLVGAPWAARLADLNHDRRPDIVVAADFTDNLVLYSHPEGGLTLNTPWAGIELYDHAMGLAIYDFDLDGYLDLYISDVGPDQLWSGTGCGQFEDVSNPSGVALGTSRGKGWGVASADFDHDGDFDLFISNSNLVGDHGWEDEILCGDHGDLPTQAHFLLVNDGLGHFTEVAIPHENPDGEDADLFELGLDARRLVIVGSGDLDQDGDIDIVTARKKTIQIYWNEFEKHGHWINVQPQDANGVPFSGARVRVLQGDHAQWFDLYGGYGTDGHSALTAHFGLGDDPGPITVQINWPDGTDSEIKDVEVDQVITIQYPSQEEEM